MSSPGPAYACFWILQLCFAETDFVLRSLPCRSACADRPWVDQVISQGELIAVVTRTKDFDYSGDCPLHSFLVYHLSSELPIHNLPLPEPFRVLDGEDYLRHDWSPVDSSYLSMYWCIRPEDELRLAILSKDAATEREVGAPTCWTHRVHIVLPACPSSATCQSHRCCSSRQLGRGSPHACHERSACAAGGRES